MKFPRHQMRKHFERHKKKSNIPPIEKIQKGKFLRGFIKNSTEVYWMPQFLNDNEHDPPYPDCIDDSVNIPAAKRNKILLRLDDLVSKQTKQRKDEEN